MPVVIIRSIIHKATFTLLLSFFTALLLRENHDFPSSGFQNKTSFLFETSQPRISLFECWDESSSDHRDVPDALPLLPCPQDPGQPDYLLLYHSCVFSNFTQTRKIWFISFTFYEVSLVTRIQEKFLFLLLWQWQHYHRSADSLLAGQPPAFETLLKSNKGKS